MEIFNFFNKTEAKAPLNIFALLKKLKKNNLLLKHSEIADIDKNGFIKTQKPIKSKKQIVIKLFNDNKSFPLKKFKVINEYTIQIKKRDPVFWKIISSKRQYIKKVKVTYFTDNTNKNYQLFVKNKHLYIKACIIGNKYCITNTGAFKDEIETLILDTKMKDFIFGDCKKTVFKDVETGKKYILTLKENGDLKLVPQI